MSNIKITYKEKYKSGTMMILKEALPDMTHLANGYKVEKAEMLSAGHCEIDGEHHEFQDIRLYVKT